MMAMDILAYLFGVIALAAGIKCFVDENWGEEMHPRAEQEEHADNADKDKKIA